MSNATESPALRAALGAAGTALAGECAYVFSDIIETFTRQTLTLYLRLYFKSSSLDASSRSVASPRANAAGYVHVCTPTQSYQVRQVSTSNSVYVTKQVVSPPKNKDVDEDMFDDVSTSPWSLATMSKVNSVLVLQPVAYDVEVQLKTTLPTWSWHGNESQRDTGQIATTVSPLQEISDQIPAPKYQIEEAWRRLFVIEVHGRAYIPDRKLLLEAWTSILRTFSLRSTLSHKSLRADDFLGETGDGEVLASTKRAIYQSPTIRPSIDPGDAAAKMEHHKDMSIDWIATIRWVGELILRNSTGSINLDEFLSVWANLVPESQVPNISPSLFDSTTYEVLDRGDGTVITWKGEGDSAITTSSTGTVLQTGSDNKQPASKRKWHEKFKASRNMSG